MKNKVDKRLWGLFVFLTAAGPSCAQPPYPTVVSGSDLLEPLGYTIGGAVDGYGALSRDSVQTSDNAFPSELPPTRTLPQIAGRPYMEVQEVVDRHRGQLMQIPHVYSVTVGGKGILVGVYVYTDSQGRKPPALPASLHTLPTHVEGIPLTVKPLYVLPPPPGAIIVRPNGVQEAAEACPRKFIEHSKFGWKFCIDPGHPQSIPAMMTPPIAGIPYEEAVKILERHQKELMELPGVDATAIGNEGIEIWTDQPDAVPSEIEGLPVKTRPRMGGRSLMGRD